MSVTNLEEALWEAARTKEGRARLRKIYREDLVKAEHPLRQVVEDALRRLDEMDAADTKGNG